MTVKLIGRGEKFFMYEFYDHLKELLEQDERFLSIDGNILRNAVAAAANNFDEKLLKILLSDEKACEHFFKDVNGVKCFKQNDFVKFINNREFLPDSYTRFKNEIRLVDENENFISKTQNISLVFPYKDCVLEGGQTKDDQKRLEIFYNETLAKDERDRLLEPKVFTCAKKFSAEGVEPVTKFSPKDNLIIKGNNLLVVSSLLERFEEKIKCIYIDVPYNTGNDSFGYNDRFNHATWLTFMKNRLELAKKLLKKDGSIWISIDDDEQAYLKILCDEIFGRDNFLANIIWNSRKSVSNDAVISINHNYILIYTKNISEFNKIKKFFKLKADDKDFSNPDNDPRGKWKAEPFDAPNIRPNLTYQIINPNTNEKFLPPKGRCWRTTKDEYEKLLADGRIIFGKSGNVKPQLKKFFNETEAKGVTVKSLWDDCGTTTEATKELQTLFESKNVFGTPKPERLIQRILTLATNEGDIVLDNFLGSGTTAAVAHKMKRQYIGVEQMDYIETVTVERLKKVIDGEQGGISKAVDWQGGGSFVYCELAKLNEKFVEEIQTARDFETIWSIYKKMVASGYISYKVDPADIDNAAKDFAALSLANQQKFLMELLDKNLLYVNYCDIDDEDFAISDADKKFSRSFYGEG